jgi:hypothetical protein
MAASRLETLAWKQARHVPFRESSNLNGGRGDSITDGASLSTEKNALPLLYYSFMDTKHAKQHRLKRQNMSKFQAVFICHFIGRFVFAKIATFFASSRMYHRGAFFVSVFGDWAPRGFRCPPSNC